MPEYPFDAIQEGTGAASYASDIVSAADGTCTGPGNQKLDFGGRLLTVSSENGPEDCIVEFQQNGGGLLSYSGEYADAVMDGFAIINGFDAVSGGMLIRESNPAVADCVATAATQPANGSAESLNL